MIKALLPLLVKKLIEYGAEKISDKSDSDFVANTAKELFGVVLDMNKPATENAKLLEPFITKELNNLSELAMAKLSETADALPEEVANRTLLDSYSGYGNGAKALIWFLSIGYLLLVAVFTAEYLEVFPELPMSEVALYTVSTLAGLLMVAVLPLRSLIYFITTFGSKIAARKAATMARKPVVTEIKVDSKTVKKIEK